MHFLRVKVYEGHLACSYAKIALRLAVFVEIRLRFLFSLMFIVVLWFQVPPIIGHLSIQRLLLSNEKNAQITRKIKPAKYFLYDIFRTTYAYLQNKPLS